MMRFGKDKSDNDLLNVIKRTLKIYNIECLRADNKEYHEDLYLNILTYLYGVDSG